jgi:hypothetical protein
MKEHIVLINISKVIESAKLTPKEIQTVLRLLAAQYPKPKAKPKVKT